jgi:hypothetical protein
MSCRSAFTGTSAFFGGSGPSGVSNRSGTHCAGFTSCDNVRFVLGTNSKVCDLEQLLETESGFRFDEGIGALGTDLGKLAFQEGLFASAVPELLVCETNFLGGLADPCLRVMGAGFGFSWPFSLEPIA